MRLCYILLSPTWGMHQYTADLANRMWAAGHDVHLVTSVHAPRTAYGPAVTRHTPVRTRNTGFSPDALRPPDLRCLFRRLCDLHCDVVHLTGPHLWNPLLLRRLNAVGVPTVHTLHDLHPHAGAVYGRLLYLWNGWVERAAGRLLVHGEVHREELRRRGVAPERIACTHLTHLCLSWERETALRISPPKVRYEPWALFLGRLEGYKGLDLLVEAMKDVVGKSQGAGGRCRLVIAGPGRPGAWARALPPWVELRNHLVGDDEAVDLLCRCGLLVLPYVEASQSALPAAAYFFRKPVIVTRVGALPEYVVEAETGWVVAPGDVGELARVLDVALESPARLEVMGEAGSEWYRRERQSEEAALRDLYGRGL